MSLGIPGCLSIHYAAVSYMLPVVRTPATCFGRPTQFNFPRYWSAGNNTPLRIPNPSHSLASRNLLGF
jgi:hypothetical protein